MISRNNVKNYLKLFMRRNEIFNKFNFNVDASKFMGLSEVNLEYVKINEFLNQGLRLMQPEDRMNLYVNLTLIREQAVRVIDNLTQPFSQIPSIEKLQNYDNIIQAVVGFEAFVKSNFAEEFTEEKIAEAFESKYTEISLQKEQNQEPVYDTSETDVDNVIDNMTEKITPAQSPVESDTYAEKNIVLEPKIITENITTTEATAPVE